MIEILKNKDNYEISLIAVKAGLDWNITIFGGDIPHIGAVAIGIPRVSLSDENKISASVSVLTVTGHKEDEIVVPITKKITSLSNSTVVVVCGIHIDDITEQGIKICVQLVNECVEEFIKKHL